MPYNVDFLLPIERVQIENVEDAPQGSLTFPVMGPNSLVCASADPRKTFFVELTTFSIHGFDSDERDGANGIVWREPKILVDPASIYVTSDQAAWSAGDIITNGEMIAIVAAGPEGRLVRCRFKPSDSVRPAALFKSWHIVVEGQRIFTKLP